MKLSRIAFPLFLVLAAIQLAVPASMIWSREQTLQQGTAFKFRTGAVDPYDIFRGRYVTLRFEERTAPWRDTTPPRSGLTVYATIAEGADGFARFSGATTARPAEGAYLKMRVWRPQAGQRTVQLDVPFDRYYLEESLAPAAEAAYRRHSRGEKRNAYVVLRVRAGQGVLEELYVAGQPILEAIAADAEDPPGS